ncbi:MAG: hypothetical protein WC627_06150 [Legionella sp.]|jgi:hypothetical protein
MNEKSKKNGCEECHIFWQKYPKKRPDYLKVNYDRHASLYQCRNCEAFWEESERFAMIISNEEVIKYYGKEFLTKRWKL